MQVGNWDVEVLELTAFDAPATGFVSPEAAPPGEIRISVNALLLRRPGQTLLIDAGTGVMAAFVDGLTMDLDAALRTHGVEAGDVNLVVLTHLDGDHVGGALTGIWPDKLAPAFPNARVVAAETEVEWSLSGGSGLAFEGGVTAATALEPVLDPVADGAEVAPGVRLLLAPGHTPGHSIVEIDGDDPLVFVGDVLHARFLVERPQPVIPDRDPIVGLATRRRVLRDLADRKVDVLATHIPSRRPARIEHADDGFCWVAH